MPKSIPRNGDSGASEIPYEEIRERHARQFFTHAFGRGAKGWMRVSTSKPGQSRSFTSKSVEIPDTEGNGGALWIEELLKLAETHNVFIGSAVFDGEGTKTENVIGGRVVWIDIDPPHLDERDERGHKVIDRAALPEHRRHLKTVKRELRKLGAKITRSGSPGGIHARIQLSRMASRDELRAINWLLADTFHGDRKWSPESVLRLPGSLNHKTDPAAYVGPEFEKRPKGAPTPPSKWVPEELVAELDPSLSLSALAEELAAPQRAEAGEAEPFDHDRYSGVLANIQDVNARWDENQVGYGSRFKATVGIVRDCRAASLTMENAVYAARMCKPLLDKEEDERGYSIAKDVSRVWVREGAAVRTRSAAARRLLEGDDEVPETFQNAAASASRPTSSVVPVFPIEALTDEFRELVEAVARAFQTTHTYAFNVCLSVLSYASYRAYRVYRKKTWREPLVIWTLHLAGPSTRKTQVMDFIVKVLAEEEERQQQRHADGAFLREYKATIAKKNLDALLDPAKGKRGAAREEALTGAPRELTPEQLEQVKEWERDYLQGTQTAPAIITTNTTPARLGTMMAENDGRVFVKDDESSFLENLAGLYSSGKADTSIANSGYNETDTPVDRQGAGRTMVRSAYLTAALASQTKTVAGIVRRTPKFEDSGFLARFLMSMPPARTRENDDYTAGLEDDVPEGLERWWNQTIRRIMAEAQDSLQTLGHQKMIRMDAEAKELWVKWEHRCLKVLWFEDRYANCQENLGKMPGNTLRIAGLLSLMEGAEVITEDIMRRAILLAEHYAQQAARVMNYFRSSGGTTKKITEELPETQDEWVTRIARLAKRREKTLRKTPFTKSAFHQAIKRHLKDTEYHAAEDFYGGVWDSLVTRDVVILVDEETPYPKYELGPGFTRLVS